MKIIVTICQAVRNPKNTVYDAKRLIGRSVGDPNISTDMFHWPFGVTDSNGKPVIQVQLFVNCT